jgi:hypothetical protein
MYSIRTNLNRPKRLLSLDGGGIRGIISAEILLKIEKIICERPNSPWHCLADYFDFIGGTSTGAILAAGLANGMKVKDLLTFYLEDGPKIFTKNKILKRMRARYDPTPLENRLQAIFGDTTLGSKQLKTSLMIVTKNVTVNSPWFFVNHPNSKYFNINRDIPLWHLIRASSAAPVYFPPHHFKIGGELYEFIDGGMSMFNSPSFQLFLETTYNRYGVGWERGKDRLLMISVGTGFSDNRIEFGNAKRHNLLDWARYAVNTLMEDAKVQQHILMELISGPPKTIINYEVSKFIPKALQLSPVTILEENPFQLLSYRRYSPSLTSDGLNELQQHLDNLSTDFKELTLRLQQIDPNLVTSMDCVKQIPALRDIGQAIAEISVSDKDFEGFLQ